MTESSEKLAEMKISFQVGLDTILTNIRVFFKENNPSTGSALMHYSNKLKEKKEGLQATADFVSLKAEIAAIEIKSFESIAKIYLKAGRIADAEANFGFQVERTQQLEIIKQEIELRKDYINLINKIIITLNDCVFKIKAYSGKATSDGEDDLDSKFRKSFLDETDFELSKIIEPPTKERCVKELMIYWKKQLRIE